MYIYFNNWRIEIYQWSRRSTELLPLSEGDRSGLFFGFVLWWFWRSVWWNRGHIFPVNFEFCIHSMIKLSHDRTKSESIVGLPSSTWLFGFSVAMMTTFWNLISIFSMNMIKNLFSRTRLKVIITAIHFSLLSRFSFKKSYNAQNIRFFMTKYYGTIIIIIIMYYCSIA